MKPAVWPRANSLDERLLVLSVDGARMHHATVGALDAWLRAGDLVVVNDAATVPASLRGRTAQGAPLELRLAAEIEDGVWTAVLFGDGDWRTRTEHRAAPPTVGVGDALSLGDALTATVVAVSERSPRVVTVRFAQRGDAFWEAVYRHGRPVQYAHAADDLALWHVQTAYAARPWAMEMPSAGRPLRWSLLARLRAKGVALASVTHAAGLSSTGDDALDATLPWPERYEVPRETVDAVARCHARGGRVIAVGTSVVRALESAWRAGEGVRAGTGIATLRIDGAYRPRVVDGVLSGMHEVGTSHYELLSAFATTTALDAANAEAERAGYLAHEFGDSVLVLAA